MAGLPARCRTFLPASRAGQLTTSLPLSPVSTQPASPSGSGPGRSPGAANRRAGHQLNAVRVVSDHLAVFRRVIFDRGRVRASCEPLAEVYAIESPFQGSAAHHAATFLEFGPPLRACRD